MKHFKLTFIVFGLFLFGCNQTGNKNALAFNEKLTDTAKSQTAQQENAKEHGQLEDEEIDSIKSVIALFKTKKLDKISDKISFPLYRQYPIPPIKDKDEFKQRFNEVFDKILIEKIANSKIKQWTKVGWRGIMLDNGEVWMANADGIITAVNHQSNFEKKLRKDLIDKGKENLYISLKTFESPIFSIKTKNYLIRIDELTNQKYRYTSWKIGEKASSKPDIIIDNGKLEFEGSGGNHVITFVKGNYTYKIYRNIIGEENTPDIKLEIEKGGQIILAEDGKLIIE